MAKVDKASEPSMDEILSTIRKIIADEPASKGLPGAGGNGASPALTSGNGAAPIMARPSANVAASNGLGDVGRPAPAKVELDDILDMVEREPAGASGPGPGQGEVPAWLFPSPKNNQPAETLREPARVKPQATRPFEADLGGAAPMPAGPGNEAPRPFFLPPAAGKDRAGIRLDADRGSPTGKSGDLGMVVPHRDDTGVKEEGPRASAANGVKPSFGGGMTERRAPQVRVPQSTAAVKPIAAPVEPTMMAARDAAPEGPVLSELSIRNGAERGDAGAAQPAGTVGATAMPSPAAAPAPASPSADAAPLAPSPPDRSPDAASALPSLEATPAAASAPQQRTPIVVSETLPTIARPTPLGDKGRGTKSVVATDTTPGALAMGGAVRTLEDTVVDLLRPMIRQWLDDNMPRMVEKALRIELAETAKPRDERAKH